ncbi:hypothetical protein KSF78_0004510 [Schistosoma japonicum]|nr:hypothetical protein KSF78_0004510 [Schistosoma japonicum]
MKNGVSRKKTLILNNQLNSHSQNVQRKGMRPYSSVIIVKLTTKFHYIHGMKSFSIVTVYLPKHHIKVIN